MDSTCGLPPQARGPLAWVSGLLIGNEREHLSGSLLFYAAHVFFTGFNKFSVKMLVMSVEQSKKRKAVLSKAQKEKRKKYPICSGQKRRDAGRVPRRRKIQDVGEQFLVSVFSKTSLYSGARLP